MERGFLFIIAIALAFGVGIMGSKRKIGFGWAFECSDWIDSGSLFEKTYS